MRTSNLINFLFYSTVSRQIYDSVIWVDLYYLLRHASFHSVFSNYAIKKHILRGQLKSGNCCLFTFSGIMDFNWRITSNIRLSNNHVNDSCQLSNLTHEFFSMYLFIYISLHVSSMSCSSSGETNCINTASGNCHSVLVAVSCAGWE